MPKNTIYRFLTNSFVTYVIGIALGYALGALEERKHTLEIVDRTTQRTLDISSMMVREYFNELDKRCAESQDDIFDDVTSYIN